MKRKNNNILLCIILFPIYLIKYIFFGIGFVLYGIVKLIYNIFKYIYIGIKTIFYVLFYPVMYLAKGTKKDKKESIVNRDIDIEVTDSQREIDEIFNKKNKVDLKKQEKEKIKLEKINKKKIILEEKNRKKQEAKQLKLEKKAKILEAKKIKKEELDKKKQEKINKKKIILEEKNRKKQEAKQVKLEKKAKILEAKKIKKEELDKKKQEKLSNKKIISEEKNNKKKQEQQLKLEKKAQAKDAKIQKKLDKKEEKLNKKRKNEAYVNENFKPEKTKLSTKIKNTLKEINNLPEKIKKSYQNSLLYKNAKNKRDQNRQILLINFDGEDAVKSEQKQVYEYVGKNAEGKIVKDYFPAFSRVEVHSFLLSEGYEVYSIKTSKWINLFHKSSANVSTKFKIKDLLFFLTQLSTYIKAGIPLVESLKILSRQFKKKGYQKIFRAMIYDLTMGESFSTAMDKQGDAFPKLLINMIKASEMTGELPEALDDMADYYTQAEQTRKQMVTALTYPSIIFIFAIGVITFIMVYVVPKFVDIYNTMDDSEIPGFTLLVMNISDFLQENLLWVFIGIVLIIVIIAFLYKNVKTFRWAVQWFLMHLPVVKDIIIYNEVTMFTKTFSSLLAHNVFITDTLEILSKITNNEIYKMLVRDTAANLERGEKISTAYKDQWAFPVPAYEMIVTGERTGQLSEMMSKVSAYYQDLHKNTVTRIKAFVEPILIVFLTVVVGFIVLAIVIPMFNMYNQVI